jgi:hypothetical protein
MALQPLVLDVHVPVRQPLPQHAPPKPERKKENRKKKPLRAGVLSR